MDKETLRMQLLAGIITESEYKVSLEEKGSINSLKDAKIALEHLYPNSKIILEKNNDYDYLGEEFFNHIYFELNKNYAIIGFSPSDFGDEYIGKICINGDKTQRYEFSNISYLSEIIENTME